MLPLQNEQFTSCFPLTFLFFFLYSPCLAWINAFQFCCYEAPPSTTKLSSVNCPSQVRGTAEYAVVIDSAKISTLWHMLCVILGGNNRKCQFAL